MIPQISWRLWMSQIKVGPEWQLDIYLYPHYLHFLLTSSEEFGVHFYVVSLISGTRKGKTKAAKRKPGKGTAQSHRKATQFTTQLSGHLTFLLFIIESYCAAAPVLQEDLFFAAALGGSDTDKGSKKMKTTHKTTAAKSMLNSPLSVSHTVLAM